MTTHHKSTNIRLFSPKVIVNKWKAKGKIWNGLPMTIFHHRENPVMPYEVSIKDYAPGNECGYAEMALDSYFTEEEVKMIDEFLERTGFYKQFEGTFYENEVTLPIPNNFAPVDACGVGGADDIYQIWDHDFYDLPFKIKAYYSLTDVDPEADYYWVVAPRKGGIDIIPDVDLRDMDNLLDDLTK